MNTQTVVPVVVALLLAASVYAWINGAGDAAVALVSAAWGALVVRSMMVEHERAEQKRDRLVAAALGLYWAGHWTCDREVDEARLWANLRDALELPPGTAPKPNTSRRIAQ